MTKDKERDEGFTPGPWRMEQDDFGDGDGLQWIIVHDGKWPLIAAVHGTDDGNADSPGAAADARLIAAAPDLLDALQEVTENYGDDPEHWSMESWLDDARVAIDRALAIQPIPERGSR